MPGGYKNINGNDGNTFKKGNKESEKYSDEFLHNLGDELLTWIKSGGKQNMFFNHFFLIKKGFHKDFANKMCNRNEYFKSCYETAKQIQETKMVKYGVEGKLDSKMTTFVLSNNHGYTNKSEINQEITDKTNEMSDEEITDRIDELLKKRDS